MKRRIKEVYALTILGIYLGEKGVELGVYDAWWFPIVVFLSGCLYYQWSRVRG